MAKRFTDTEKYKDPWFRKLKPELKMLFLFICDDCNHAGIWKENFDSFELFYGKKMTHEDMKGFGDKILRLNEDTYYIKGFIKFQYGILYENNSAHLGVIKQLVAYNIDYLEQIQEKPNPSLRARLSSKAKMKVFESANFTCEYCGKKLHPDALVIDHIAPLTRGGLNIEANLSCSCATCKAYKGDTELNDFVARHPENLAPSNRIFEMLNGAVKEILRGTGYGIGYSLNLREIKRKGKIAGDCETTESIDGLPF